MATSSNIDPMRLVEAAEAVLVAVVEAADAFGGQWPYPPDLMGTEYQPAVLDHFTKGEVEEGTKFLIRLGILEAPKHA